MSKVELKPETIKVSATISENITKEKEIAFPFFCKTDRDTYLAAFEIEKGVEIVTLKFWSMVQLLEFDLSSRIIKSEPITEEEFYNKLEDAFIKIGCAADRRISVDTFPTPEEYGTTDDNEGGLDLPGFEDYQPLVESLNPQS